MPITRAYAQAAEPGNFFVAGKNKIINGDFRINQRAFSSTTTDSTFGFDRWLIGLAGDGTTTYSAQTFTPGTAPVTGYEAANYARMVTTGQTTSNVYSIFLQKIEDVRTFANQTVTISFWAKANTGTPSITVELQQNYGTGGTASSDLYKSKVAITTSWARYSVTLTPSSISGKTIGTGSNLTLAFWISAGSNFNSRTDSLGIQTNTFDFWGVQVEAGAVATPFTTATGTLAGELAACQRYYFKVGPGTENNAPIAMGMFNSAGTAVQAQVYFPQQLRIKPSSIDSSNLRAQDISNGYSMTSVTLDNSSSASAGRISATVSGATAFRSCFIDGGTGAGYLAFNAEL